MSSKGQPPSFQTALVHHREGRLEQAIAVYRQLLEQDSGLVPAWTNLAIALKHSHHLAQV